ncbi:MAG: glycosyltransferase family 2 protein [Thermodesulfobacteriota bacterium]
MDGRLTDPLVSIILPTYNRPDLLDQALRSIHDQTYRNYEILVINDGGVDVQRVIDSRNGNGNIVYLQHDANRGVAAARNTGIAKAKGKYLAYLDDDDQYYPDHLATLVEFLENRDYQIAYTDAYVVYQRRQGGRYLEVKKVLYSRDFDGQRLLVENFIPTLCLLQEKSCLDKIGLFDESLATHEDWDLWIRLSREYPFAHLKKVTGEFARRDDINSMTAAHRADFLRTAKIIYERYKGYTLDQPQIRAAQKRALLKRKISLLLNRIKSIIFSKLITYG